MFKDNGEQFNGVKYPKHPWNIKKIMTHKGNKKGVVQTQKRGPLPTTRGLFQESSLVAWENHVSEVLAH